MSQNLVYGDFAEYYDLLMQDAPYDLWLQMFAEILDRYEIKPRIVADLGCGTGTISIRVAEQGYRVFAVDASEDMLAMAEGKREGKHLFPTFLQQDIRELHLPTCVDVAISFCDTLNYLLEEEHVQQTFHAVYRQLHHGGLFFFDMHTPYKLEHLLGDQVFYEVRPEIAYIWQSSFDGTRCLVEYDITFFAEVGDGLYRRFQEQHLQRAYPCERVVEWLYDAGFQTVEVFADFSFEKPTDTSERWFFVARK
ncbi:methyltransferase [Collibacillus ludicampi]|uniref:Methyltransferase n=1 Tax=Collibacillus ludicampi TaxID=2771369 RepID=A0AAV4LMQ1_9BACL|nr:class I SAM-dependent methyltransferase [Collibacillus ludicampi]GIM48357.1 methyltransferase [Collibacillus ludicampi]